MAQRWGCNSCAPSTTLWIIQRQIRSSRLKYCPAYVAYGDVSRLRPFRDKHLLWSRGGCKRLWTFRGLNPGPHACEACALPLCQMP
ncbi:hypothetical protein BC628DRAFT_1357675, partial [Trametes gibbosa]